MITGVAIIGAVAAVIALAVTLRLARQEELALQAEAESLERRLELRLARIEARLGGLDDHLQQWTTATVAALAQKDTTIQAGSSKSTMRPEAPR
jgi:hypothetical protein